MTQKKKSRFKWLPLLILLIVAAVIIVIYFLTAIHFRHYFFPNTTINGYDVSGLSAEDADNELRNAASDYLLTIYGRDNENFHLAGTDFDYSYTLEDTSETYLQKQNWLAWIANLKNANAYELEITASYDTVKLNSLISSLSLFTSQDITAPENAQLIETENGFEIQPEVPGNTPSDHAVTTIEDAVKDGLNKVTLSDSDYVAPEITSDDAGLVTTLDTLTRYLQTTITYDIEDYEEVLDASTIRDWIVIDGDNQISLDDTKITAYVQSLASKYNTYGDKREFATSSGDTITIGGGDYGWVIDKEAEKEAILSDLEAGSVITREPNYSQTASVSGHKDDIGNTYLEIDYTKQHIWYYKDGVLQCESDIVSGNISRNNGSPDGVYKIVYKQSPATLVGEDYASDVTYFLPFAYNVGVHDADWRSEFGGEIYKKSGSHGCINVPYEFADELYHSIETGTPVIAYYREPVTLTANNARISNAYSYVAPETN